MKRTYSLALIGVYTALLIGAQLALYSVSGIEVVSVLLLAFSFTFGVKKGVAVATSFSLLRCLIFGFIPQVIILYLIYYNLFAIVFGAVGKRLKNNFNFRVHLILILLAVVLTVVFTCLDNLITPLFYGYGKDSAIAYFYTSIYVLIPHAICVGASVLLLLKPLLKALKNFEN